VTTIVEQLTQGVKPLLASIGTHSLQGLNLVQDEHEAGPPAVAQDCQQAGEEVHRPKCVEVAFHAGSALNRSRHVGLASKPSHQALREGRVVGKEGATVGPQHGRTPAQFVRSRQVGAPSALLSPSPTHGHHSH
jgi:hypothetical protein